MKFWRASLSAFPFLPSQALTSEATGLFCRSRRWRRSPSPSGGRDLVGIAGVAARPVERAIAPARQGQGGFDEITVPRPTGDACKSILRGRQRCKALQIRTISGAVGRKPRPWQTWQVWFADTRLAAGAVRRNQGGGTRQHMKNARTNHGLLQGQRSSSAKVRRQTTVSRRPYPAGSPHGAFNGIIASPGGLWRLFGVGAGGRGRPAPPRGVAGIVLARARPLRVVHSHECLVRHVKSIEQTLCPARKYQLLSLLGLPACAAMTQGEYRRVVGTEACSDES